MSTNIPLDYFQNEATTIIALNLFDGIHCMHAWHVNIKITKYLHPDMLYNICTLTLKDTIDFSYMNVN